MNKPWLKHYEAGVPETIDPNRYSSILQIFEESFKSYESLPAFTNMGATISYGDLREQGLKFADYLQNELKLQRGDRVAIMMPNILQYPVALVGVLYAGCVAVNCNPLYTPRELEHQLRDSGAKAIVVFENAMATLEKVIANTSVKHVITTQIGDMLGFPKSLIVNFVVKKVKKMVPEWNLAGTTTFKAALSKGNMNRLKVPKLTHKDLAFLQYTGGTTGVSKGAELTHGNIVANMMQAFAWIKGQLRPGEEIIITPLPLYHIFSLTANFLIFSSLGGLNVLITNPRDVRAFVKELKRWKFTALTGLNTLFNLLLNDEEFRKVDFSALRLTLGGGMAVQRAVAERWAEVTKCAVIEAYGLTETAPAACVNPMTNREFNGYIGLPISSTEIAIRNDENEDCKYGEVGEICIRGPQVMRGYWNRPDETAKVMTPDGFFKSGDLGFMTADGYVKIVDRKKDMILVSGFNVYPNEIEDVMIGNPKIAECAAIGVADDHSGEVVKLFVVKKDPSLTIEELKAFAKANLTGYKCPKHFEFRNELPKSNVGKILRKELRASEPAAGSVAAAVGKRSAA
ncbi:long-chain-fatty-acid--CoA ligase [bacterium]|nr:long-chain-fatty-acid--CoA ligase [bacterium]